MLIKAIVGHELRMKTVGALCVCMKSLQALRGLLLSSAVGSTNLSEASGEEDGPPLIARHLVVDRDIGVLPVRPL